MQDIARLNQLLFARFERNYMHKSVVISVCSFIFLYLIWVLSVFAKPLFPEMDDWENTDFSTSTVELRDLFEGGPGKNGIQSIDNPTFESLNVAGKWLSGRKPVVVFSNGEQLKAYPLQILMYHEIINDYLVGQAISVT